MSKEQPRKELVLGFTLNQVLFFMLLLIPAIAIAYKIGRSETVSGDELHLNLFTEFLGVCLSVIVTVLIIDRMNDKREDKRRKRDLKDRLLREVCSAEPEVARKAFHEIRRRRMMFGEESILKGETLTVARPGTVDLSHANLSGADLSSRDLRSFDFVGANLENANLKSAELTMADLDYANLLNANLENSDLSQATLIGADLTGANLLGAKIYRDNLYNHAAEWPDIPDTETPQAKLPDGNPMCANTDLAYFTDQNYPGGVWRSDDPKSPAYRVHFEERLASLERFNRNRPSNLPTFPSDPT